MLENILPKRDGFGDDSEVEGKPDPITQKEGKWSRMRGDQRTFNPIRRL